MPRTRSRAGFTLIELVAVVGVLGMVMFFVIPSLDNISPRAKLKSHARRLASTIELCQGEAAGSGKEFVLAYDLNKGAYWVILPPPDPSPSPSPGTSPTPTPQKSPTAPAQNSSGVSTDTTPTVDPSLNDDPEHGPMPDLSSGSNGPTNTTSVSTSGPGTGWSAANKANGGWGAANKTTASSTPVNSQPQNVPIGQRDTLAEDDLPPEVKISSVTPLNGNEASSGVIYVPFSSLGDEGSHIVVLTLTTQDGRVDASQTPISIRFNALTRTIDFSSDKMLWQTISGN